MNKIISRLAKNNCHKALSTLNNAEISPSRMCVEEATNVMGYSPPFFKRWLENEEIGDIAFYMGKLSGTKHPLITIAKNSLFKNDSPAWGLIILLLSKAGGLFKSVQASEKDTTLGILHKQRILAEVTELIRTSILIHKGILTTDETRDADILIYGNKISLLSGDYLFSKVFHDLAHMRNSNVFSIVATALRDLSEGAFLLPVDYKNRHLPAKPRILLDTGLSDEHNLDYGPYNVDEILGNCKDEWILRNLLGSANLLGKSCHAAMVLAGHAQHMQEQAYLFGKHLALAWQANIDYNAFHSDRIDLVSLPVMLHLQKHPEFYSEIEIGLENIDQCDFDKIKNKVKGSSALEETKRLQVIYASRALGNLGQFDDNGARTALEKLLLLFK